MAVLFIGFVGGRLLHACLPQIRLHRRTSNHSAKAGPPLHSRRSRNIRRHDGHASETDREPHRHCKMLLSNCRPNTASISSANPFMSGSKLLTNGSPPGHSQDKLHRRFVSLETPEAAAAAVVKAVINSYLQFVEEKHRGTAGETLQGYCRDLKRTR